MRVELFVDTLDNGGYLVIGKFYKSGQSHQSELTHPLMSMVGYSPERPESTEIKLYAPDSQHVGMAIQELLDKATVEKSKG